MWVLNKTLKCLTPSWRNWKARPTSNRKAVGSSPTGGIVLDMTLNYLICWPSSSHELVDAYTREK